MNSTDSKYPFSVRFDKDNPRDQALPLSPYEFNAVASCGVFDIPAHRHSHLEIMITEADFAVHGINGKEYPMVSHSVCFFMPHHVHRLRNEKNALVNAWFIDFDPGFIFAHFKKKEIIQEILQTLYESCPCMRCDERVFFKLQNIAQALVRSFSAHADGAANALDQYHIMQLIELILPLCKKDDAPVDQWWIPSYIIQHLNEEISTKEIAAQAGWSIGVLNRFFQKEFGQTFSKTITDLRMAFAGSILLARPQEPIVNIAQECGIPSESTFYRLFKDHYGITPKEYRRTILKRFFDKTDDALPLLLDHELLLEIHQDHAEALTLKDFSQSKGVNAAQLNEDFVRCMGESFSRYLEDIRLIHAKNLLSMTVLSVDEVGRQVGYPQARSFTRAFSRKFKITPTEYRRQFKDVHQQSDNLPLR